MKKGIIIAIGILMLFALATICYAQNREAQIVNQYRTLCAQEKETEQLLEGTQAALQEIQGRLRERRVADKEIRALKKTIKKLEKQREETLKKEADRKEVNKKAEVVEKK